MASKMFVLMLTVVAVIYVQGEPTEQEKLATDLMKGYVKEVDGGDTPLTVLLSYLCADLDPRNYLLTSRIMEKFTWIDTRLKWDPKKYADIDAIRLPAKNVWIPDMKLFNSDRGEEKRDEVNVLIRSNGTVLWVPIATYYTSCLPARRHSATCDIKLGSWTYNAKNMKLQLDGEGYESWMYSESCPFDVSEPIAKVDTMEYPCCPGEPYASYSLKFRVAPKN